MNPKQKIPTSAHIPFCAESSSAFTGSVSLGYGLLQEHDPQLLSVGLREDGVPVAGGDLVVHGDGPPSVLRDVEQPNPVLTPERTSERRGGADVDRDGTVGFCYERFLLPAC